MPRELANGFNNGVRIGEPVTLPDGTVLKITKVEGAKLTILVDRPGGAVEVEIASPMLTAPAKSGKL